MNPEELVRVCTENNVKIKHLEETTSSLSKQISEINNLVLSVNELAINMKTFSDEQKEQGKRLERLENQPLERTELVHRTIINSIVSILAGGLAVILVQTLADVL